MCIFVVHTKIIHAFFLNFNSSKITKKLINLVFFVASIILLQAKYILEKRYKKEIEENEF